LKKSKFSEDQVVRILGEVNAGKSVREVCASHGLSEATLYAWKRKYGGMETDDAKRLRSLEAENAALKRIVADQALLLDATGKLLRKNLFGPRALESGATFLMKERISARKSCQTMGISRRGYGLRPGEDRDGPLREALRNVWRPNMGYRMAHARVRKEFAPLNVKRVHRVWKEERLGRVKRYRKRRTGNPVPLCATHPNHVWRLDFVFDSCLNGTKLKVLAVKDEFTKERLALEVGTSFRSLKVRRVLEACFAEHGNPQFLRSDDGSEFVARTPAVFLSEADARAHFVAPGSPWLNGSTLSFNSRLRAERLDVEVFHNLADAGLRLAAYRRYHNEERPHSALGYATPAEGLARFLDSTRATPSRSPENGVSSASSP
jgi:putative transposase